ncbi:MAG: glycosyltransferase family 4 protein [Bacteroidetes bacterium]|nr:glycosyltransferase family 4 protein [Bacteroidota bacterium]HET6244682.1 glycosyltransferase family 4 protein [Bacteroidia bacterium]
MLKIVFTTDGIFPYSVGGIQRHSRLLIEELAKRDDIHLSVVHPHKNVNVFPSYNNIKEITVDDIDTSKLYISECFNYSQRVYEAIKDIDCDVVYAQGISIWYKINNCKNKLIVNPHGLEAYQAISLKDKLIGFPFRLIQNYIFSKARYIASEGGLLTKILIERNPSDKIVFLPNAVNLPQMEAEHIWNKEKINLLFLARFASNKGINILIKAIEELNWEGFENKLTFNLAGKGPLFEYYSTNYKFSNVNYLGFVADDKLESLYQDNDLFVLPTLFEGMPTVVLEAMSHKMPVVVSDVGATAELVDDTNGYLIKKNNVGALKKAILSFYHLPAGEKEILSQKSYQKVKSGFTWEQVAKKHVELFEKMISKSF